MSILTLRTTLLFLAPGQHNKPHFLQLWAPDRWGLADLGEPGSLSQQCLGWGLYKHLPPGSRVSLVIQLVNESTCQAGDLGSGRSSGEGNGNPLQCSCLRYAMERGAWWATVHGMTRDQPYIYIFILKICRWVVFGFFEIPWTVAHLQSTILCPWDFPGMNTGVGCHSLLQGIFPTQGSKAETVALAGGFFTTEPY